MFAGRCRNSDVAGIPASSRRECQQRDHRRHLDFTALRRRRSTLRIDASAHKFAALFNLAERETDEALSHVLRRAAHIADALLANQTDIRPLHGDLHHDNIISGGARGWLAIDPQGLLGDPAYDVANVFGNPLGAFDDIINPARITALMSLFANDTGCSEDKILRYALAHAGVSICWSLEDGTLLKDNENARERLAFFNVAVGLLKP